MARNLSFLSFKIRQHLFLRQKFCGFFMRQQVGILPTLRRRADCRTILLNLHKIQKRSVAMMHNDDVVKLHTLYYPVAGWTGARSGGLCSLSISLDRSRLKTHISLFMTCFLGIKWWITFFWQTLNWTNWKKLAQKRICGNILMLLSNMLFCPPSDVHRPIPLFFHEKKWRKKCYANWKSLGWGKRKVGILLVQSFFALCALQRACNKRNWPSVL